MNIDANRHYVGLASNGTIATPLVVDPVSGRLMVEIRKMSSSVPHTTTKIDGNRTPSALVYDGVQTRPLLVDSSGYLLIDLNVE
jgi:hypothetical protein